METRVMTAHVPLPLAEKVDALAARLERSRGWIIKQALAAWVEEEELRQRLIAEASADVRAGHVVDDADLHDWFDRLEANLPTDVTR